MAVVVVAVRLCCTIFRKTYTQSDYATYYWYSGGSRSGVSSMIVYRVFLVLTILHHILGGARANAGATELTTTTVGNALPNHIESRTRIVGGFNALEGRFPYGEVSLEGWRGRHQCGGSVVAKDMILTAGHCMRYFSVVKVGEYDKSNTVTAAGIQIFSSIEKIRHPDFEASMFRNDVMLVKLDGIIEGIVPVRLNQDEMKPSTSSVLTLIGWGTVDVSTKTSKSGDGTFPEVLQQASLPYIPNSVCESSSYDGHSLYRDEIFDEMMCAGTTGVDACSGDSGSPLLVKGSSAEKDVQVGLVSWGHGCGKYPGVYSRISHLVPWIRKEICWRSINPPSYLQCQPEERGPYSPTLSPSPTVDGGTNQVSGLNNLGIDGSSSMENNPILPSNDVNHSAAFSSLYNILVVVGTTTAVCVVLFDFF
jgi:trypsin